MMQCLQLAVLGIAGLVVLVAGPGCQSLRKPTVFSRLAPEQPEEIEYVQPHRMAVIWTEDSLPGARGQKPTRGFGGRVYFYDQHDKPVRVDGELIVYAYDDSSVKDRTRIEGNRTPDRKYVFLADALQQRFSQSNIGPSYNIFVPWDEAGGPQKTVSLVPAFKPASGQIVGAGHAIAVLRGKPAEGDGDGPSEAAEQIANLVRQTSAVVPGNSTEMVAQASYDSSESANRRTTTIAMPRHMGRQLAGLPQGGPATVPPKSEIGKIGENENAAGQAVAPGAPSDAALSPLTNRSINPGNGADSPPVFGAPGPIRR